MRSFLFTMTTTSHSERADVVTLIFDSSPSQSLLLYGMAPVCNLLFRYGTSASEAVSVEEEPYAFSYVRLSGFGFVLLPHEQHIMTAITANTDDTLFIIVTFGLLLLLVHLSLGNIYLVATAVCVILSATGTRLYSVSRAIVVRLCGIVSCTASSCPRIWVAITRCRVIIMISFIALCTCVSVHISAITTGITANRSGARIGSIATICGSGCAAAAVAAIIVGLSYRNH